MKNLLRRLRGLIGNGVVWATAWVLGAFAFTIVPILLSPASLPAYAIGAVLSQAAVLGFASGSVFSIVLGIAYRNRFLEDIRPLSLGVLGASAGLIIPLGFLLVLASSGFAVPLTALVPNLVMAAGLGGLTSVASLKLARLAPGDPFENERLTTEG